MLAFYHCLAVYCVFQLLLGFLGTTRKEQTETWESQGPERLMWVLSPIVCFCCYSCMTLRKPTSTDLAAIWVLVLQFMVFNPIGAAIESSSTEPESLFIFLRFASLFLMVYGIIVMIESVQGAFASRRPHMKFWTLKG